MLHIESMACIGIGAAESTLHFWKMFSKDLGSFPFLKMNEPSAVLHFYNIFDSKNFHSLKRGEDGSRKSEKDIMCKAFFCKISSLSLMNLVELERNQI